MWLMQTVANLIIQDIELCEAWDTIKGIIDKLDSRQAFVKDKSGRLQEPRAAYL